MSKKRNNIKKKKEEFKNVKIEQGNSTEWSTDSKNTMSSDIKVKSVYPNPAYVNRKTEQGGDIDPTNINNTVIINGITADFSQYDVFERWFSLQDNLKHDYSLADDERFHKSLGNGGFGITYVIQSRERIAGKSDLFCIKIITHQYVPKNHRKPIFDIKSFRFERDAGILIKKAGLEHLRGMERIGTSSENSRFSQYVADENFPNADRTNNGPPYLIYDYIDGKSIKTIYRPDLDEYDNDTSFLSRKLDEYKEMISTCYDGEIKRKNNKIELRKKRKAIKREVQILIEKFHILFHDIVSLHTICGMFHHDISPNNIFQDRSGNLILIDCGEIRKINDEAGIAKNPSFAPPFNPEIKDTFKLNISMDKEEQKRLQNIAFDYYCYFSTLFYILTNEYANEIILYYDNEKVFRTEMRKKLFMLHRSQADVIINGLLWHLNPKKQLKIYNGFRYKIENGKQEVIKHGHDHDVLFAYKNYLVIRFILPFLLLVEVFLAGALLFEQNAGIPINEYISNVIFQYNFSDKNVKTAFEQFAKNNGQSLKSVLSQCLEAKGIVIDNGEIVEIMKDNVVKTTYKERKLTADGLNSITFKDIVSLCPNLNYLLIYNCKMPSKGSSEYQELEKCANLWEVTINGCDINDLSFLKNVSHINLTMRKGNNNEISGFSNLTQLKGLRISNAGYISFSGISGLDNLSDIYISNSSFDVEHFPNLPASVTNVAFNNCDSKILKQLKGTGITELGMTNMDLTDLSDDEVMNVFSRFSSLRKLTLDSSKINGTYLLSDLSLDYIGVKNLCDKRGRLTDFTPLLNCKEIDCISSELVKSAISDLKDEDGNPITVKDIIKNAYTNLAIVNDKIYFSSPEEFKNFNDDRYSLKYSTKRTTIGSAETCDLCSLFPKVKNIRLVNIEIDDHALSNFRVQSDLCQLEFYSSIWDLSDKTMFSQIKHIRIGDSITSSDVFEKLNQFEALFSLVLERCQLEDNNLLTDYICKYDNIYDLYLFRTIDNLTGFEKMADCTYLNSITIKQKNDNPIEDWSPLNFMEKDPKYDDRWVRKDKEE